MRYASPTAFRTAVETRLLAHSRATSLSLDRLWLGPPVVVPESRGFSPREFRDALEIVTRRRAMMEKA